MDVRELDLDMPTNNEELEKLEINENSLNELENEKIFLNKLEVEDNILDNLEISDNSSSELDELEVKENYLNEQSELVVKEKDSNELQKSEKKNNKLYIIKKYTYLGIKRLFDISLSLVGFIFVIIVGIIIKISYIITGDFDSIIFKQTRTGKDGKNFKLYKFRSMTIKNDVRDNTKEDQYTKVGKVIRKLSLDELLQMVNILKGDMSFIGPRPWIPEYYQNFNSRQKHRCDMRPGISGYAQVKGRNNISIFDKINYDLIYIEKASLWMDIKIIILTVLTIFGQKGVDAGKSTIHEEINELKEQEKVTEEVSA